jgi:hypothetical protein
VTGEEGKWVTGSYTLFDKVNPRYGFGGGGVCGEAKDTLA